jgi:hypothetical protein
MINSLLKYPLYSGEAITMSLSVLGDSAVERNECHSDLVVLSTANDVCLLKLIMSNA